MALTKVEFRSLMQIAAGLQQSDPALARALQRGRFRPRRIDVATFAVGFVVLVTLIIGVAYQLRVVCAVAWTVVLLLMVLRGMFRDDGY